MKVGKQIIRINVQMILMVRAFKKKDWVEYGTRLNKVILELEALRMMGCPSRSQVEVEQ